MAECAAFIELTGRVIFICLLIFARILIQISNFVKQDFYLKKIGNWYVEARLVFKDVSRTIFREAHLPTLS